MIRGPEEGAPVPGSDRRRRRPGEAEQGQARLRGAWAPASSSGSILTLEEEMHEASADLRFEYAARLRDEINDLQAGAPRRRLTTWVP